MPGHLSPLGIKQAKQIAERLKDVKIDYIYSSDLKRAKDTALEILKYHPNIPIEFTSEIRQRYLGEWEGKTKAVLGILNDADSIMKSPKDGESFKDLYLRAGKFIPKIVDKHKGQTILLVCHNYIAQALLSIIKNIEYTDDYQKYLLSSEKISNTSINIFEIDENKICKVEIYNCTKHLV